MAFDLKVGFACDNDCVHCVITDKAHHGNLSTERIIDIVKNEVKPGEEIVLTGGEPTIRKDFFDILSFIKENTNSKIILQTNGKMFGDVDFAKRTLEYVDIFLIAIHSCQSQVHDKITGVKGSHRKTVEGIYNIVSNSNNKHEIISQTVLSKYNIDFLLETYDLIHKLGIRKMNMTFPHPMGNSWTNFDEVVPQYRDIKDVIHKCFKKYGFLLSTEAIPICYIYPYLDTICYSDGNYIDSRGYDQSSGNPVIEDYESIILKDHRKVPECKECIYDNRCIGVWKEYYEKYKDKMDLVPIKE